ncbi:hypothetical protein JCM17823_17780 [Halorubrum gandharaense]
MEINRADVDRRLRRLRDAYPDAHVVDAQRTVPGDRFAELRERARAGYVGTASVRVRDDRGKTPRVLVVMERDEHRWTLPGAERESSGTFESAATRATRELTGVVPDIDGCLRVDRVVVDSAATTNGGDGRRDDDRIHLVYAVFDAVRDAGSIVIDNEQLAGAAWVAERPARTTALLSEHDAWFPAGTGA